MYTIGMYKIITEFPNYQVSDDGLVMNIKTGHILTPVTKNGYYGVRLSRDGRSIYKSLHILVYEAFHGIRSKGMHIDHINGVRTDNRASNLRELTPQQNNANRLNLVRGENVNTSKLSPSQVIEIRSRRAKGESTLSLAREFGIAKSSCLRIISGKSWSHLPISPVNDVWHDPKSTGGMSGKKLRDKYGSDYFAKIAKGKKFKKHCDTCSCGE